MTVLSKNRHDNVRPGQQAVLEFLEDTIDTAFAAPLRETMVSGEVAGPLASLTLAQVFDCSFLPEGRTVETVYRFPLPGDGIVQGVVVYFGEAKIQTRLTKRIDAAEEYDGARESGRQAVLFEQESDDVFSLHITGISGAEPVRVETEFLLWLPPAENGSTLRIPLTLAPRYSRMDETGSRSRNAQPLDVKWDPGHRAGLSLTCRGYRSAECPSNALRVSEGADGALQISFEEGKVFPDQDIVLTLVTDTAGDRPGLQVFPASDGNFLALATLPAREPETLLPREILLLVDHSGSMSGPKWEAADWAVETFLSRLDPSDWFNLAFFHDTCRWLSSRPVQASKENISRAGDFIRSSTDSGGTELGMSLKDALSQQRQDGECSRHVVVFTDGQVTDGGRISLLLEREAVRPDARRVSIVCIDSAPNEPLASMIAEKGRGLCSFLSSNPDDVDITTALDGVLREFSRPLAAGACISSMVPLRDAAGTRTNGNGTLDLGDLVTGRSRWVCGRSEGGSPDGLSLLDGRGGLLASARVSLPSPRTDKAVRSLWSSLRIRRLEALGEAESYMEDDAVVEALRTLGAAPEKKARQLYEGRSEGLKARIREVLARESLGSGVLCSETAFIAVRDEKNGKISETLLVPNALPRSWSGAFSAPAMMASHAMPFNRLLAPAVGLRKGMRLMKGGRGDGTIQHSMMESTPLVLESDTSLSRAGKPKTIEIFSGLLPAPAQGKTVLFSGMVGEGKLKNAGSFNGLSALAVDGTTPDSAGRAEVRILVNGTVIASVTLAELLAQGKKRPLNIRLQKGDCVAVEISGQPAGGKCAFTLHVSAGRG